MNGYKTIIAGIISFIVGIGLMLGVELPPELIEALKANIETVIGAVIALYGVIMSVLRHFTEGKAPWKK